MSQEDQLIGYLDVLLRGQATELQPSIYVDPAEVASAKQILRQHLTYQADLIQSADAATTFLRQQIPTLIGAESFIAWAIAMEETSKALTHRLERLNSTLDILQQEWKQRNAKRKQFRAALGIEANAANKF